MAPAAPAAKKLYERFAEIGRVVLISYGPDAGKLATIVDIVDQNLALVDGPANLTGVRRQVINFKWLSLTDLKASGRKTVEGRSVRIVLPRNARQKTLTKVWEELGLMDKWNSSSWGKKVAGRVAKAAMTDLDRFKAKVAKRGAAGKKAAAVKA